MTDFGAGLYLTTVEDVTSDNFIWDVDVDETGDLRTTQGTLELEKDLAFSSAVALQDSLGQPITPTELKRIENEIADVFGQEPRIDTVRELSLNESGLDEIEVVASVLADESEIELVFGVDT